MENIIPSQSKSPWLVGMVLLILGVTLGALITYLLINIKAQSNARIAYNFVSDQTQAWKELISEATLQLTLDGTITDIKEGATQFDNQYITGRQITLSKGSTQASIFVRRDTAYEGADPNLQNNWNKIAVDDLKVGDHVYVKVSAVLNQNVNPNSFYGWWVFRYTQ